MNKVYPERINWEDEPSVATPLGARNLNKIDYATYEMDNRIIALDAGKANQVDELLDIKSVAYNPTTGVWTFTHQNGTVDTFDQNIEKIPVSFAMDENGVITMTAEDGTTYTCDVGTLIKTYTFVNSGNIQFTVTTDAQGNKSVTANIIDGSVTRAKLDPNLLSQIDVAVASASASAESAGISANTASNKALDSEAYAIGTRNGVPVTSDDPAYNNNSKYYAEQAGSLGNLADVGITNPEEGDVITYNSTTEKWENKQGVIGNTSDDIPYLSRETNNGNRVGSKRVVKDLVGGSVVANQLISDNSMHIVTSQAYDYVTVGNTFSLVNGHKYLASLIGTIVEGTIIRLRDVSESLVISGANSNQIIISAPKSTNGTTYCQGKWNDGTVDAYINVIDLTAMFGTTVADALYSMEQATAGSGVALFRQLFPNDYYAYQTAELLSVKPSAMVSGGKTYPISEVDLRGLLSLSNGKWVYDGDIRTCGGEITRKYGIVDLGNLTWTREISSTNVYSFKADISNAKGSGAATKIGNILCALYVTDTWVKTLTISNNKSVAVMDVGGKIAIQDDTYTDATTFKTAMDGVYLIYELATPTTEYVPAFSEIQDTTENGTESFTDARTFPMPVAHHTDYPYGEISDIIFDVPNTRERQNITNRLGDLSKAIAEQNLEKYGYKIGDYFLGTEQTPYIYYLADLDTFYGGYTQRAVVNEHHIGIVVNARTDLKWNNTDDTSGGYDGSALQTFLSGTALDNIKADMIARFGGSTGLEHLIQHQKLFTVDTGTDWAWRNKYISALTEVQIYGCTIASSNYLQTGEACTKLELFTKYRYNQIFGDNSIHLRDIFDSTRVCNAGNVGRAGTITASTTSRAVGLILLK